MSACVYIKRRKLEYNWQNPGNILEYIGNVRNNENFNIACFLKYPMLLNKLGTAYFKKWKSLFEFIEVLQYTCQV
jgi:hypothetical protein